MRYMLIYVFLYLWCIGCSSAGSGDDLALQVASDAVGSGDHIETTVLTPDGDIEIPKSLGELEQLVDAYGKCYEDDPSIVGFAIQFDPSTGQIGDTRAAAAIGVDSNAAEARCEAKYSNPISDYKKQNPLTEEKELEILDDVLSCIEDSNSGLADEIRAQAPQSVSNIDQLKYFKDATLSFLISDCVEQSMPPWRVFGTEYFKTNFDSIYG